MELLRNSINKTAQTSQNEPTRTKQQPNTLLKLLAARHTIPNATVRGGIDFGGELGHGVALVASQFVDHASLRLIGGQHRDGGFGKILSRSAGEASVTGRANISAVLDRGGNRSGLVLGVPAIAQQGVGNAGRLDRCFRLAMLCMVPALRTGV